MSIKKTVKLLSQGISAKDQEQIALIEVAAQCLNTLKAIKQNKTRIMNELRKIHSGTSVMDAGLLLINSNSISPEWKNLLQEHVSRMEVVMQEKRREAVAVGDEHQLKALNAAGVAIKHAKNHPNWDNALPDYRSFDSTDSYPPLNPNLMAKIAESGPLHPVSAVNVPLGPVPHRSLRNYADEDINKRGWVGDDHPFHGHLAQPDASDVYNEDEDSDATEPKDFQVIGEGKVDEVPGKFDQSINPGDMSFGKGERHEPLLNRKNKIVAIYDKEEGIVTTLDDKDPKTYVPWSMVEEQTRTIEEYKKRVEELQRQVNSRQSTPPSNATEEEKNLASGLDRFFDEPPLNYNQSPSQVQPDILDDDHVDDAVVRALLEIAQRPVRAVMEHQNKGNYTRCPKNVDLEGWLNFVNRFREDMEDNALEGNNRTLRTLRQQFQLGSPEELHFQRFKRDYRQRYGQQIPFEEMIHQLTQLKLGAKTRTYWIERASKIEQGSSSVSEYIGRFSHECEMFRQFSDITLSTAHFENGLNNELTRQLIPFTDIDDLFQLQELCLRLESRIKRTKEKQRTNTQAGTNTRRNTGSQRTNRSQSITQSTTQRQTNSSQSTRQRNNTNRSQNISSLSTVHSGN